MGEKKEYIERGALIEFVKQNTPHIDGDTTMQCVERAMKAAPAADVVEVVHGEWIESTNWGVWYYDCPFCDDFFIASRRHKTPPNFCSNCGAKLKGAKMDGERKEQT